VKIGIYNESSQGVRAFDGSERYSATLAWALSSEHEVEFVHHKEEMSHEHLARFCGLPLENVRLRSVPMEPQPALPQNPKRRFHAARDWRKDLSAPYDLFVAVVHDLPPFCHAPNGVLIALFPAFNPTYIWPQQEEPLLEDLMPRKRIERSYHLWEWKQRLDSYQLKLSISGYVREWTRRRWGVESQILYPSGDANFDDAPKENLILSVGRFATQGVLKRQMEMTYAFTQMQSAGALPSGWSYFCGGASGALPEEDIYFQNVRDVGAPWGAEVVANIAWEQLKTQYARAKIFWHGAGYGVDVEKTPSEVEHFGIVTVEAMAAGCVPVVINKGGQREIVRHGIDGFLWNTLDELQGYTSLLARNETLRERMSSAARQRAAAFTSEEMARQFKQQAQALLR
jgi:glycosyltransferase involved in cell wall biosynthesis